MTDVEWWPANYFASRDKFIDLAESTGAHMTSRHVVPTGPNDEALSVDVASFVSDDDEHRIVLTSGVHGVEGYIGASIQIQALRRLAQQGMPTRTGVVLIHAVNPWGYAHHRRVDENNIDVNRNFIDFDRTDATSHAQYAALDPIINPPTAPGTFSELRYWLSAGKLIARHGGIGSLVRPIAQGQCDYPRGLFFSGQGATPSRTLLQDVVHKVTASIERITILDIHSGLGPSGTATLIANSNMGIAEERAAWLRAHYGQPVVMDNASGNAYNAQGSWSRWCQDAFKDTRFLYLCVEIGTVNPIKLFSALRRENQAHHWATRTDRSYTQTKDTLLGAFSPPSQRWRERATAEGMHALKRSFELEPREVW